MAVTAKKLDNRDVYEFEYDGAANRDGGIVARFTNEDGGESDYRGLDDGKFVSTVQKGYKKSAEVVIEDADGGAIDSGTVQFG